MEALVMFFAVMGASVVGLLGLDLAAFRWGADSRGLMPDDHHR